MSCSARVATKGSKSFRLATFRARFHGFRRRKCSFGSLMAIRGSTLCVAVRPCHSVPPREGSALLYQSVEAAAEHSRGPLCNPEVPMKVWMAAGLFIDTSFGPVDRVGLLLRARGPRPGL